MIEFAELRGLPIFDGCQRGGARRAAAHAADVRVDAGQWLVREGEAAAFYVLLSGSFDLLKRYPDGLRRLARARDARRLPGRAADRLRHDVLRRCPRDHADARGALRPGAVRLAGERLRGPARAHRRGNPVPRRGSRGPGGRPARIPVVIGRPHDPDGHGVRDFLSRNQVRFEWANPTRRGCERDPSSRDGARRRGRVLRGAPAGRSHARSARRCRSSPRQSACRSSRSTTPTTS